MTRTLEDADLVNAPKSFKKQRPVPRKQNLKSLLTADAQLNPTRDVLAPTFANIEATPSLLPPKKYCDLTGLASVYCDPKTKLRYHDREVYEVVKTMSVDAAQAYLALRNSQIVLR